MRHSQRRAGADSRRSIRCRIRCHEENDSPLWQQRLNCAPSYASLIGVVICQPRSKHQVHRGDVAQLGERVVRNDEVVGSIPIVSTNEPACISQMSPGRGFLRCSARLSVRPSPRRLTIGPTVLREAPAGDTVMARFSEQPAWPAITRRRSRKEWPPRKGSEAGLFPFCPDV